MILPRLRGYRPNLSWGILRVGCRRCRKPWVIYERIGAKAQRTFPMWCPKCQRRIVVRLVVEGGRRTRR